MAFKCQEFSCQSDVCFGVVIVTHKKSLLLLFLCGIFYGVLLGVFRIFRENSSLLLATEEIDETMKTNNNNSMLLFSALVGASLHIHNIANTCINYYIVLVLW